MQASIGPHLYKYGNLPRLPLMTTEAQDNRRNMYPLVGMQDPIRDRIGKMYILEWED